MPLDEKQNELFEIRFGKRFTEIMKDTSRELREADYQSGQNIPSLYSSILKKHVEKLVTARIDAYIDTVVELKVVPEKDDFLPLAMELQEMARKSVNTFEHKMKSPHTPSDGPWLQNMTELLRNEIDQIVGHAVPRLKYFIDERSLLNSISNPIMNLTEKEKAVFTSEWSVRKREIDEPYQNWINSFEEKPYGVFSERIRNDARETIKSRVQTYIEICKRYRKYPDQTAFDEFGKDAKRELDFIYECLVKYLRNPLGPLSTPEVDRAREEALSADLRQILSDGLAPLRTFMLEGEVMEESKLAVPTNKSSVLEDPAFDQKSQVVNIQNLHGDFVGRDQVKAGDNLGGNQVIGESRLTSIQPSERKASFFRSLGFIGWTIMFVLALVATVFTVAAVPEGRQFLCDKTGFLCIKAE